MHKECRCGNLEHVMDFVDHKCYDVMINERNDGLVYGRHGTPLHMACGQRHHQIVEFLLSKPHCNVNSRDLLYTPLHVACSSIGMTSDSGLHLDSVKLFLARDEIEVIL